MGKLDLGLQIFHMITHFSDYISLICAVFQ